jgi:endo-1,4-beta-xylanase
MRMIRRMHPRLIAAAVALIALPLFSVQALAQIAAGQSKFLGSTVHSTPPELKWTTYWNQETPENDGKWGSVEATQGVFTFTNLDADYNFAIANGFKFKFHNLVWGAQQPSWLTSLSQAQQLAAVQTWISTVGARYPKTWAVDVVNEPIHTPPSYMAALGGSGTTGWDWVINAFTMARAAFPNSMLLINEFGTEQEPTTRATYLQIVALLKARGLIDGIGVQGHYFNLDNMSPTDVQTALDSYATAGLPVYISELDMTGQGSASGTDAGQLAEFQSLFPVIWNHPAVQGVTTWGYIVGQTWHTGTGLLNTDGTERPALTWLKGFVAGTTQLAIAATPATLNIVAGGASASDTLSISGATGAVTLTASNVPAGVTVTFSPNLDGHLYDDGVGCQHGGGGNQLPYHDHRDLRNSEGEHDCDAERDRQCAAPTPRWLSRRLYDQKPMEHRPPSGTVDQQYVDCTYERLETDVVVCQRADHHSVVERSGDAVRRECDGEKPKL